MCVLNSPEHVQPPQGFTYDKDNSLPCDAIVVDEVSMLDVKLAYSLLQALNDDCLVLLVGDPNQLPAIDAGALLINNK